MWLLDELKFRRYSNEIAVISSENKMSYRDLWKKSEIIAGYLEKHGYDKVINNSPVVIYGNKEIDILPVILAVLKVGLPYVFVNTIYSKEELFIISKKANAKVLFNFSNHSICFNSNDSRVFTQKDLDSLLVAWFDLYSNEDHWVTYEDSCCLRISTENEKQSADIFVSTIYVKDILMWIDFYKAKGIKISSFIEKSIQHCLCDINMDDLYIELPSGKAIFI